MWEGVRVLGAFHSAHKCIPSAALAVTLVGARFITTSVRMRCVSEHITHTNYSV